MAWCILNIRFTTEAPRAQRCVFLLDRETTIQQKPAALRANIPVDIQILCWHNFNYIAAKRPEPFRRASSPARGKNYSPLVPLCPERTT